MAMAQKYKVGMYLGPDNIYFKEELPKKKLVVQKDLYVKVFLFARL